MSATKHEKVLRPSAAACDPMCTSEVDVIKKKYYVHRALLIKHSEFFKKALTGPWKEAQDSYVKLEGVECDTFEFFIDWLYTGRLPADGNAWRGGKTTNPAAPGQLQLAVIKTLVFANRIIAPVFQRAVNVYLVYGIINPTSPCNEAVTFAFANLPTDDPVLTLLVELQYRHFDQSRDTHVNGEIGRRALLPHEFLLRVMLRLGECKGDRGGKPLAACDYHGHDTDEERKACEHKWPNDK